MARVITNANALNAQMVKSYKRKFKETDLSFASVKRYKLNSGRLGNPKSTFLREPPSYQHLGVKHGWTDVISCSPVYSQTLDYGHGTVTVASSGGGGTQLHTTTTKSYHQDTLQCLVCKGEREGHYILDNHEGRGITIMLGD